ncbi:MAG: lysophospholipid acyltransferase family protein [Phycisphaerales bacterium]
MVSSPAPNRIELPPLDGLGDPVSRRLMQAVQPRIERMIGIDGLNAFHDAIVARGPSEDVNGTILDCLETRLEVDPDEMERIPREGPLVVVANHPFGGIEGVALAHLLHQVRPDSQLMANYMLSRIPVLRDAFFFVDPFGGPEAARKNLATVRKVMDHVSAGNCLGVFPAGEVSHATLKDRRIVDPPWSDTVSRIVRRTGATVVPIYFDGRNSLAFQLLGFVHPRLRTLMLGRELLGRAGSTIRAVVGSPIAPDRLRRCATDGERTEYMRARTYMLRGRIRQRDEAAEAANQGQPALPPVIDPIDPQVVRDEIDAIPASETLAGHGSLRVIAARPHQIPETIREIGRLREITFRQIEEGTGTPCDVDRFDAAYVQLILWDDAAGKIVGGYRIGATDEIIPASGLEGLYTRTLFSYRERLIDELGPALELGRSFVVPEYQRTYAPLMLLWKAIGAYVCRQPRYRMLFGPVSISNAYHSMSRELLVRFLQSTRFLEPLGRLITPRRRVRIQMPAAELRETGAVAQDLEDVEAIVKDIEAGRRSVPILLRQYLKLNGKLLAFNVDPDFGDVVDGLMLIDLCQVDSRVLQHYMGKKPYAAFMAAQGEAGRAAAADVANKTARTTHDAPA